METDDKRQIIDTATALFTDIAPLAIGLNDFVGCLRSFSISKISFRMYIAEEIIQKDRKPAIAIYKFVLSKIFRLKNNGRNIRQFLR